MANFIVVTAKEDRSMVCTVATTNELHIRYRTSVYLNELLVFVHKSKPGEFINLGTEVVVRSYTQVLDTKSRDALDVLLSIDG